VNTSVSKDKSNNSNNNNLKPIIFEARVLDIILDKNKPDELGSIKFRKITDSQIEEISNDLNIAYPASSFIKNYPVRGETVWIINLPDRNTQNDIKSNKSYYVDVVNIWNHPQHNALPDQTLKNDKPNDLEKYTKSNIGLSSREIPPSQKLGNTFIENPGVNPLMPREGDRIFEGRFGNSIRLTSNTFFNGKESTDPVILIRNGKSNSINEWDLVDEDLNYDSLMIISENIEIPLDLSEFNQKSLNINNVKPSINNPTVSSKNNSLPSNNPIVSESNAVVVADELDNIDFVDVELEIKTIPKSIDYNINETQVTNNIPDSSVDYLNPGQLKISKKGLLDLIKREGSVRSVYDDETGDNISLYGEAQGNPTIGVGHLIKNNERDFYSIYLDGKSKLGDEQIQSILMKDLSPRENTLNRLLKNQITQNMFDSLLSLMFNAGSGNRYFVKAIEETNKSNYDIASEVIRSGPTTTNGKSLDSLVDRRNDEANIYLS
jgi:GH24 family phage-related lysozyme (muramidase)